MQKPSAKGLARFLLVLSGVVFAVGSAGMSLGVEPFSTWYYSFAWWPYIVAVESFLKIRTGVSSMYDRPGRFFALLPLSVALWLVFECFNFRLSNWHYLNLPESTPLRWLGYGLNFATVLPGLFATRDMLAAFGVFRKSRTEPVRDARRLYAPMAVTGAVFLILPLALPTYFFPLVWGGFIFLLEPLNHRLGGVSLLRDLESGLPGEIYRWLVAGLVCGLLWETWNYWAVAKWYYTVPLVGNAKLFEMPVAGFLGFPPFALECWVLAACFFKGWDRLEDLPRGRRLLVRTAVVLVGAAFCLTVFHFIDVHTVDSFRSS